MCVHVTELTLNVNIFTNMLVQAVYYLDVSYCFCLNDNLIFKQINPTSNTAVILNESARFIAPPAMFTHFLIWNVYTGKHAITSISTHVRTPYLKFYDSNKPWELSQSYELRA